MKVRLFTSGQHKGLNFDDDTVKKIYEKSSKSSPERVPFVIGHPKNDLPVIGYLPRKAMELYNEGGRQSIGFDRDAADFSEESLEVLKKMGANKLSVRLSDGVITHIGLVDKPAVAANAKQDFKAHTLSGVYAFGDIFTPDQSGAFEDFFNRIKSLITKKEVVMAENKEVATDGQQDLLGVLRAENERLKNELTAAGKAKEDAAGKEAAGKEAVARYAEQDAVQRFNATVDGYKLGDEDTKRAKAIAAILAKSGSKVDFSDDKVTVNNQALDDFGALLSALVTKPQVVNGSVTASFAADKKERNDGYGAALDSIKTQIGTLK